MYKLWEALKEEKKYRWVELSHSLNNDSPYWAGIPEGSVAPAVQPESKLKARSREMAALRFMEAPSF